MSRRRGAPPRDRKIDLERYRSFIPDWEGFLAASARPEPTVFRVRAGRAEPGAVVDSLSAQGYELAPVDGLPGFYRVAGGPRPVSFTLEHWLGLIYVQQASTGVAAPAIGVEAGERVLDLCSAPGGKTTHMADVMGDRGCVVASEVNEGRIRGLLGNVYRLGHPGILSVSADGRDFPEDVLFDRVLVDAPCSGEGTLRRRGGTPPNQSARFLRYVTRVQEALLRKAIRVTRPGGTVLYVTCTFAPEENEAVVSRVLADAPVELEPLSLSVPHAPGLTHDGEAPFDPRLAGAARIYPHHLDSGGLFLARLRRLDDGSAGAEGGWGPVPAVFSDAEAGPEPSGGSTAPATEQAVRRRELARATLVDHFGVSPEWFDGHSWIERGGRLWLHGLEEWPVAGWSPGRWRVVSVGLRAMEFDPSGRPRPTNEVLQLLDSAITASAVELGPAELRAALAGPLPWPDEMRGLQAIRFRGHVLGRGVPTTAGLRSEISKARARDLQAVIEPTDS